VQETCAAVNERGGPTSAVLGLCADLGFVG
jgi:hypothetical protein